MTRELTLAIIYGGRGAEHDISRRSAEYLISLAEKKRGIRLLRVLIDRAGEWFIEDGANRRPTYPVRLLGRSGLFLDGKIIAVDAALPVLHGDFGEDGSVQGALECAGITYAGSGVFGSAAALDKCHTKIVAERLGIPTVEWVEVHTEGDATRLGSAVSEAEEKIGYPMFVKPICLGSSIGAAVVRRRSELRSAIATAATLGDGRALVERLVEDKRELECALIVKGGELLVSHPAEVLSHGFYSFTGKYSENTPVELRIFADVNSECAGRLAAYSRELFFALSLRDLARIDFFLSGDGIYLNEVNTMPGFTGGSLYPRLIDSLGISPEEQLDILIGAALSRAGS
ncbi:MAG: D-alanine--D-alanine ligase [Clostridia bacterium]|nr:D-alanine--D-alanine ligase [Clostridia bacterium]